MQITLGGGCFWCIEAVMKELKGVETVLSGYAGGHTSKPTYEQVCGGRTGHAEVVQVNFNAKVLPLEDLLEVFFSVHDPTTKNRQGADVGTQYRSCIFTSRVDQEPIVYDKIDEMQQYFDDPIVTEVAMLGDFWPAESYHRDYYARNPDKGYCRSIISPKMAKLRQNWAHRLKNAAT